MSTANRKEVMLKQSESVFDRRTQFRMIGNSAIKKNRVKNILFMFYEMREKKIICNLDIKKNPMILHVLVII